jgi:hypothetical protein
MRSSARAAGSCDIQVGSVDLWVRLQPASVRAPAFALISKGNCRKPSTESDLGARGVEFSSSGPAGIRLLGPGRKSMPWGESSRRCR